MAKICWNWIVLEPCRSSDISHNYIILHIIIIITINLIRPSLAKITQREPSQEAAKPGQVAELRPWQALSNHAGGFLIELIYALL